MTTQKTADAPDLEAMLHSDRRASAVFFAVIITLAVAWVAFCTGPRQDKMLDRAACEAGVQPTTYPCPPRP